MNENKQKYSKAKIIMTTILAVAVCFISFGAGFLTKACSSGDYTELEWALDAINDNYYALDEDGNVVKFTVDDYLSAISATLLDPYSEYMNTEEYREFVSSGEGNAYGIGLRAQAADGVPVTVLSVSGNSPLDKACFAAGIDPVGRQIVAVSKEDGSEKVFTSDYNAFKTAINEFDAHVSFLIYFDGIEQGVKVSRENYVEAYVSYCDSEKSYYYRSEEFSGTPVGTEYSVGMPDLPQDTAYVKFDEFNGDAASQMAGALAYMQTRGKTKLILDMRNNGGGYLNILCRIASYFIDNGGSNKSLVATAKYKNGKTERYYTDGNRYVALDKLTVIANENSASATECLIGALLTYNALSPENLVVTSYGTVGANGNATYGKGIMQKTFLNSWGSAIKLTTAYIYWPDETTNIHGKGIFATIDNSVPFANGFSKAVEVSKK